MNNTLTTSEIQSKVIAVLKEMTVDWDIDFEEEIQGSTRLIDDLGFESIDIVQLVVSIEQAFNRKGLPFEKLFMQDGDYVSEIEVQEIVNFLHQNLS